MNIHGRVSRDNVTDIVCTFLQHVTFQRNELLASLQTRNDALLIKMGIIHTANFITH